MKQVWKPQLSFAAGLYHLHIHLNLGDMHESSATLYTEILKTSL
jgi:hypothetical protein